jgi:hypothetical protein
MISVVLAVGEYEAWRCDVASQGGMDDAPSTAPVAVAGTAPRLEITWPIGAGAAELSVVSSARTVEVWGRGAKHPASTVEAEELDANPGRFRAVVSAETVAAVCSSEEYAPAEPPRLSLKLFRRRPAKEIVVYSFAVGTSGRTPDAEVRHADPSPPNAVEAPPAVRDSDTALRESLQSLSRSMAAGFVALNGVVSKLVDRCDELEARVGLLEAASRPAPAALS